MLVHSLFTRQNF